MNHREEIVVSGFSNKCRILRTQGIESGCACGEAVRIRGSFTSALKQCRAVRHAVEGNTGKTGGTNDRLMSSWFSGRVTYSCGRRSRLGGVNESYQFSAAAFSTYRRPVACCHMVTRIYRCFNGKNCQRIKQAENNNAATLVEEGDGPRYRSTGTNCDINIQLNGSDPRHSFDALSTQTRTGKTVAVPMLHGFPSDYM